MKKLLTRQNILLLILIIAVGYAAFAFLWGGGSSSVDDETTNTVTTTQSSGTLLSTDALKVFSDPHFILLSGSVQNTRLQPRKVQATLALDPLPPEDLVVYDMQVGGKVLVEWDAPADATVKSFTLYRSDVLSDLGQAILKRSTNTSYVDEDLTDGQLYQYTVVSLVADGTESTRYARSTVTPSDQSSPAAPTSLSLTDNDEGGIDLAWTLSEDEDVVAQDVYRSTKRDSLGDLVVSLDADATTYTDTTVTPEVDYYFSIIARDEADNASAVVLRPASGRSNPFERRYP